jgi:1-acyl-sn-glycerol-3-phosphate acyltransferase
VRLPTTSEGWARFPVSPTFIERWKTIGRAVFGLLFRLRIHHRDRLPPTGPYIVAANHPSYLDPLLVGYAVPTVVRSMAWDAIFRLPVLGPLAARAGGFPVVLSDPRGPLRALRTAAAVLEAGGVLVIFPEGGRSRPDGGLEPFHAGVGRLAVQSGCPIYPISVLGTWLAWPRRALVPRPTPVHLVVHPPVQVEPGRVRDRHYHETVSREVAGRIGELVDAVRLDPRNRRRTMWLPPDAGGTLAPPELD